MAGNFGKVFKNIWGAQPAEDLYDEYDEIEEEDEEIYSNSEIDAHISRATSSERSYGDNVVSINTTTRLKVIIKKPTEFSEVFEITEYMREKNAIVINLEETPKDVARIMLDFLSGATYISDGKIDRIAASTVLITPTNVDLLNADSIIGELENNGLYF